VGHVNRRLEAGGLESEHLVGAGIAEPAQDRYMIDYGSWAVLHADGKTFRGPSGRALQILPNNPGRKRLVEMPDTFNMITSVAALHHMDARAALDRMCQLLALGGTLAIIGLARSRLPADLSREAAAVVAHRGYKLTRTYWEQPSPVVWPQAHTYAEMHALAQQVLPGARYRRHLLWRYSLIWTKP
jgi:hypothetical protein